MLGWRCPKIPSPVRQEDNANEVLGVRVAKCCDLLHGEEHLASADNTAGAVVDPSEDAFLLWPPNALSKSSQRFLHPGQAFRCKRGGLPLKVHSCKVCNLRGFALKEALSLCCFLRSNVPGRQGGGCHIIHQVPRGLMHFLQGYLELTWVIKTIDARNVLKQTNRLTVNGCSAMEKRLNSR